MQRLSPCQHTLATDQLRLWRLARGCVAPVTSAATQRQSHLGMGHPWVTRGYWAEQLLCAHDCPTGR